MSAKTSKPTSAPPVAPGAGAGRPANRSQPDAPNGDEVVSPPTRVLIVDDSALMRALLKEIIDDAPDLEVVGAAHDPLEARELIKELNPDVLTLDIEMPRMDGLEFLSRLMRLRPMPVVMISTLTAEGSEATLRALELGAVDFVTKPQIGPSRSLADAVAEIQDKIRAAAQAKLRPRPRAPTTQVAKPKGPKSGTTAQIPCRGEIVLIGASTGGTEALRVVLEALPPQAPPVLVVQHMPEGFTTSFARRLDSLCAVEVREAKDGDKVRPGSVFIAPGNAHLLIERHGRDYLTRLSDAPPVNRHRPAVDVLFESALRQVRDPLTAVILTGMGRDGAQGMAALHAAGAYTLAQDEETCVVYGMPRAAAELGAVDRILGLDMIAEAIMRRHELAPRRNSSR